jgi:plasmid stabilization system protein ParE
VQVLFLKRAQADVIRLRQFLEPHGDNLARRVVQTLVRAAHSLETFPDRGRPAAREGYRELIIPFGRGAYIMRYLVDHERDAVLIARIWHSRENRV